MAEVQLLDVAGNPVCRKFRSRDPVFSDLVTLRYFRTGNKGIQLRKCNRALREQNQLLKGVKIAP